MFTGWQGDSLAGSSLSLKKNCVPVYVFLCACMCTCVCAMCSPTRASTMVCMRRAEDSLQEPALLLPRMSWWSNLRRSGFEANTFTLSQFMGLSLLCLYHKKVFEEESHPYYLYNFIPKRLEQQWQKGGGPSSQSKGQSQATGLISHPLLR